MLWKWIIMWWFLGSRDRMLSFLSFPPPIIHWDINRQEDSFFSPASDESFLSPLIHLILLASNSDKSSDRASFITQVTVHRRFSQIRIITTLWSSSQGVTSPLLSWMKNESLINCLAPMLMMIRMLVQNRVSFSWQTIDEEAEVRKRGSSASPSSWWLPNSQFRKRKWDKVLI